MSSPAISALFPRHDVRGGAIASSAFTSNLPYVLKGYASTRNRLLTSARRYG